MARLIDADAFKRQAAIECVRQGLDSERVSAFFKLVDAQPTVGAPAEKVEKAIEDLIWYLENEMGTPELDICLDALNTITGRRLKRPQRRTPNEHPDNITG